MNPLCRGQSSQTSQRLGEAINFLPNLRMLSQLGGMLPLPVDIDAEAE